jgi:hypothetical protein
MAQYTEHRAFDDVDEIREFPNGRAEVFKVVGSDVGQPTFQCFGASNDAR